MNLKRIAAACAFAAVAAGAQAITVVNSTSATDLANVIAAGSGVTITNATLTTATPTAAGTFSGGGNSVGFDSGIVLTTGSTTCIPGPNSASSCSGPGDTTSLAFDFTTTTGEVFFNYVFGSEEYTHYVGKDFNDKFELRLNGVNIALLPGGLGAVEIDNVNCEENSQFYRNNLNPANGQEDNSGKCPASQNLDIQLDGLTVVLKATGLLVGQSNHFEFIINDEGDDFIDSAVFIQARSFGGTDPDPDSVPEPGSLALIGLALAALAAGRRRN